jgi:hypothetical protein
MEKSANPIFMEGYDRPFLGHIGAFAFQLADHVSKPSEIGNSESRKSTTRSDPGGLCPIPMRY